MTDGLVGKESDQRQSSSTSRQLNGWKTSGQAIASLLVTLSEAAPSGVAWCVSMDSSPDLQRAAADSPRPASAGRRKKPVPMPRQKSAKTFTLQGGQPALQASSDGQLAAKLTNGPSALGLAQNGDVPHSFKVGAS